jgi:LmbE family N-acetylglucosaminyl deacetylase
VWLTASPRADHAVDVTDVVDRKLSALRSHVSQVGHMPDLDRFVTDWMRHTARTNGLPDGRLAEAFHVVHTE